MGMEQLTLGLSSCLMGDSVRYDGNHKYNSYIVESLGKHCSFKQICPEVAIGLGTPREPIHLVELDGEVHCRGTVTQTLDVTESLKQYAHSQTDLMNQVSGYIFKKGSPSCGIRNVKLLKGKDTELTGMGIFAQQIAQQFPLLPLADEHELEDVSKRFSFIHRVFVYRRWREMLEHECNAQALKRFHSYHHRLFCSYGDGLVGQLQALVDQVADTDQLENLSNLMRHYIELVMTLLSGSQRLGSKVGVKKWLQKKLAELEAQRLPAHVLDEIKSSSEGFGNDERGYIKFLEEWSSWSKKYLGEGLSVSNSKAVQDLLHCFYLNPQPLEFELLSSALDWQGPSEI